MVSDYVIAYLPAAAALVYGNGNGERGGVRPGDGARAGRAPFSRQEATAVAGLFPKDRLLLVGSRATESAFKKLRGRYDVLHLATHGYFNKFNPLLSGLELEPDGREDGRLEVHEILGPAAERAPRRPERLRHRPRRRLLRRGPGRRRHRRPDARVPVRRQPVGRRQPLGGQRPVDDAADEGVLRATADDKAGN